MQLQLATWTSAIGEPSADGINKPLPSVVRTIDGTLRRAYVKNIPPREITVEIICALLADMLRLPVPEPMLVRMPLPGEPLWFGSATIEAPTFKHVLEDDISVLARLKSWHDLVPAGCFDEWIANPDRHLGNVLYDGLTNFWLIDHGLALTETCKDDVASRFNRLWEVASDQRSMTEISLHVLPKALGVMQDYKDSNVDLVCRRFPGLTLPAQDAVLDLLRRRQPHLRRFVVERFPQSQTDMFDGDTG